MTSLHRLVELHEVRDSRGRLSFGQDGDQIPFTVRRIFTLSEIPKGVHRGGHAHKQQHQFLIMTRGSCSVMVDDGVSKTRVVLDRPSVALYAPPMLWLELFDFSADAVCTVLASGHFDEADYVRDRDAFLSHVAET